MASERRPVVRRADERDHHALLELIEQFNRIDGHDFDRDRIDRALVPLLRDDAYGQVWILGDDPIGYAVITWGWSLESGGRECLLDEIYVAQRARGLGSLLLSAVIDHARAAGATAMFLETEAPNDRARRFYEQLGFHTEDSTWLSRDL